MKKRKQVIFLVVFLIGSIFLFYSRKSTTEVILANEIIKDGSKRLEDGKYIFLVPVYGLGNRLRTMADFHSFSNCFSKQNNLTYHYEIIWKATSALHASFDSLFSYPLLPSWKYKNVNDYGIFSQSNLKNISGLLGMNVHKNINYGSKMNGLNPRTLLIHMRRHQHLFILSAWGFSVTDMNHTCYQKYRAEYYHSLKPSLEVQQLMNPILTKIETDRKARKTIIGVHFRETDFVSGYKKSTATVNETMTKLSQISTIHQSIFISSDNSASVNIIKTELLARGFNSIYSLDGLGKFNDKGNSNRNTVKGMQFSTADLFLLSKCTAILSNARKSSFSKLASDIGDIRLIYVN